MKVPAVITWLVSRGRRFAATPSKGNCGAAMGQRCRLRALVVLTLNSVQADGRGEKRSRDNEVRTDGQGQLSLVLSSDYQRWCIIAALTTERTCGHRQLQLEETEIISREPAGAECSSGV